MDVCERFVVHSHVHIVYWMLRFFPILFRNQRQQLSAKVLIPLLKKMPMEVQSRLVRCLDPKVLDDRLLCFVLYRCPSILDRMTEKSIQRLFDRRRKWFCRFVRRCPSVWEYIYFERTVVRDEVKDEVKDEHDGS